MSLGVPAAEVAVVTPYQAQVSLISSMLREDYPEMTIGSVDGLQGQEREVDLWVTLTLSFADIRIRRSSSALFGQTQLAKSVSSANIDG